MKPAPFSYAAPGRIEEALELLERHGGDAKVLAGGQSLLPMVNLRLARPELLVDVNRVAELSFAAHADGVLRIGATTRQHEAERRFGRTLPALGKALHHVGHVATRARGTVCGSIAHADPAGELPTLLVLLDGEVVARSARGERTIQAPDFQLSTFTTALADDELMTEVRLPVRPGARHGFVEIARRHGDFGLVGAAVELELDAEGRIERLALALFGVADVPRRMPELERELVGRDPAEPALAAELRDAVSAAVEPGGDVHATGAYRRRVAGVAAARALQQAITEQGVPA